jgi:hypothetical protein
MKKSLLTVAAAAMAAVAAHADTTVYEYNFNNFPAGPVAYSYYSNINMTTKIVNLTDEDKKNTNWISVAEYSADYGLIAENSNGTYRYGLSVVDLGEAGKALCLNGATSGLSNYLGINLPALPEHNPFHGLSFSFGNKTESLAGKKLRLEVTYAIYQASEASATRLNCFYVRAQAGNPINLKGDVSYSNLKKIADPAASYTANVRTLDKWVTVTHDFEVASSGYVAGPFFFEMQVNNGGTINDKSLLIKSVKLSEIDAIDSNNANGNVTTSDFGAVKAVAATAWTPTITDGVLAYPHAYCNESAEYAMKRVSGATDAELLAAVKAANDSFVDADFAPVAEGDYFSQNADGNWTVKDDAVADYVNPVAAADDAETLEKVVLAVRVKAGANNVVVGESYYSYGKNSDGNTTTTGVTDITIAGDDTAEYYNLSGVRVANPTTPGLYIRRQGTKATKVVIK